MRRGRAGPIAGPLPHLEDLLEARTPRAHGVIALHHRGCDITYQELSEQVSRLACGLAETFEPGELLALWLPNGPKLLCLLLASLKTGVVPLPLHAGMKGPEVQEVLTHARVRTLITTHALKHSADAELTRSGLDRIFLLEPPSPEEAFSGLAELQAGNLSSVFPAPPENALGLVLLTSGSKGGPKGAMLSRENIQHILQDRLARTAFGPGSVLVVASCLTQSVGLYQSLALLAAGGRMVLLDDYDLDPMIEAIHQHRPTHLIMVVDAFDRLLHHPAISMDSLRSIVFAAVGADRVTARVQDRFLALTGRPLRVSYGLTESSWALFNPGERADKALALGFPGEGVEVRLLDHEGREAVLEAVGEIFIRSPRTMRGYLHDEELTRQAFRDGWLATGDLARRDTEGYFWFAGRLKNLIVLSSGDTVSPLEIEHALLCHPGVLQAAVAGTRTAQGNEVPWAFVVRSDESLREADLKSFLRARLSDFKIPPRIDFVDALPIGLTGKIQGT